MEKAFVFKSLFPDETYNESKLDKVASEALKVVRRFITVCCTEEHSIAYRHWITQAQFFRQRGLDTEYRAAMEQLEKQQDEMQYREQEYFFRRFNLEAERVRYLSRHNNRKSDFNIPETIQNLDIIYIITKMEYCSSLLRRSNQTNLHSPQSFTLLNEVLDLAKNQYLHVPVVAAYYYVFRMLLRREEQEGEAYQHLKQVLDTSASHFSPRTLRDFQAYMRNHMTDRYNRGDSSCLAELHDLFKAHAAMGTLVQEDGHILASTLQTTVNVALKLGEHAWATQFLEEHRHIILGADDSETIYLFNLANCHFHQREFDMAEKCLAAFQFKDLLYKTAARRLELKLMYETDSPLLFARLDAFKTFVHELKQVLQPATISLNNHFTDLLRQILSPKTFRNAPRINMLIEKLKAQKAVAEREWLMGKLTELREKA